MNLATKGRPPYATHDLSCLSIKATSPLLPRPQYTIPAYIVAYATQAPFAVALLGITYAILSSSWDEDVSCRKRSPRQPSTLVHRFYLFCVISTSKVVIVPRGRALLTLWIGWIRLLPEPLDCLSRPVDCVCRGKGRSSATRKRSVT